MFDAAFLKGETWGFPGEPVEHVETHAAHVFLVGDRAFKIKKDVKLPYLDFSDAAKAARASWRRNSRSTASSRPTSISAWTR